MTDYFVSKSSYNAQTRRSTYVSKGFTDIGRASLFFSESKYRAEAKARKTEGYRCTICLSEQNGNLFRELKRVEI